MADFVFGFLVGFLIFYLLDQISFRIKPLKKRFWDNPVTFFGYHIHHSFYGLIIVLVVFNFLGDISTHF